MEWRASFNRERQAFMFIDIQNRENPDTFYSGSLYIENISEKSNPFFKLIGADFDKDEGDLTIEQERSKYYYETCYSGDGTDNSACEAL